MPLHVRRSSDPALMTINGPFGGGESRVQTDETPSRKNPTRWSTTAGFLKARHSSGTNSLERKVGGCWKQGLWISSRVWLEIKQLRWGVENIWQYIQASHTLTATNAPREEQPTLVDFAGVRYMSCICRNSKPLWALNVWVWLNGGKKNC